MVFLRYCSEEGVEPARGDNQVIVLPKQGVTPKVNNLKATPPLLPISDIRQSYLAPAPSGLGAESTSDSLERSQ